MFLNSRNPSSFQSGPETEGKIYSFSAELFRKKYFLVIYIYALVRFSVNIAHSLKTGVISGSCVAEIKNTHNSLAFPLGRDLNVLVHPEIAVSSGPAVPGMYGIPVVKLCGHLGIDHSLKIFLYRKFLQIPDIPVSVFFHFCNSSVKFPVC